jgi:GH15 family glucan-1,4-alpha-glucosidase
MHLVHSKAMCWVALDRAIDLAGRGVLPDRSARWREAAGEVRRFVETEGWDEERRSYIRAPERRRDLDASLVMLCRMGYADPGDRRIRDTIAAVERELREGPYLYRYRGPDGVEGGEGAFLPCSFWLVDALARCGRLDDAVSLMDELIGIANDVGLYAEEADPATGEFLGNFPQGLCHIALVNAAVCIEHESQRKAA